MSAPGNNINFDIDADELVQFLTELDDLKKTVSEANGGLRSRIKGILDETGWHKGALAMIRQIADMSETKRADFLRTFTPMFGAMREYHWDAEQVDLLGDEAPAEAAE